MTGRISALKTLGLRDGAGRVEIDEAYRRLIKLHHPDRTGGDAQRAAEINHAYTMLRREVPPAPPRPRPRQVTVPPPIRSPRQRRRSGLFPTIFIFALLCGAIAGAATLTQRNFDRRLADVRWPALTPAPIIDASSPLTSFDGPLNDDLIDNAVGNAMKFRGEKDEDGAWDYSRNCQAKLRASPNLAWFDACAAFDEAMATLRDDDTGLDSGPFSDSELMTRELSAARLLSDDSLAADARLHQIRSRVEIRLIPKLDAAAADEL